MFIKVETHMKKAYPWRGVFAIPMTPFDDADRIDAEVLRAEIEFCIEAGVGGLCTPVMVSEFDALSEEERRLMVKLPIEAARGRVPVIACCSAVNTPLAVSYARFAEESGADGLIAMPPFTMRRWDFASVRDYFRAIAEATTLPVMIQNAPLHGLALAVDEVIQMCQTIERVCWVKEEAPPPPQAVTALLSRKCSAIVGLMTGHGGMYLPTDHARGAAGIITACQFADLLQRLWVLLETGRDEDARDMHEKMLPALILEQLLGRRYCKHVMMRRGIFRNDRVRGVGKAVSSDDQREMDRVWERLQPLLQSKG